MRKNETSGETERERKEERQTENVPSERGE